MKPLVAVVVLVLALMLTACQPTRDSQAAFDLAQGSRVNDCPSYALVEDPLLMYTAQQRANALADSDYLHHSSDLWAGVPYWAWITGENVGVGYDLVSIEDAFMASAPHRANLCSSSYSAMGVGAAYEWGRWWVVQVFAG